MVRAAKTGIPAQLRIPVKVVYASGHRAAIASRMQIVSKVQISALEHLFVWTKSAPSNRGLPSFVRAL